MSKSHSASAMLKFTPLAEARSLFHWPPWVGFDHTAIVLSHQGHSLGSCWFPGSIVAMSSLLELARTKKPQPSAAASLLDLVSSTKPRASSSDSDESESGQGTSGSSSDATSSSEESSSENSELARLRRKARTEKARASYMKNVTERKTRMKLEKNQLLPNSHPAAKFLKDVAPHSKDEITKAGSRKTDAMTRTRLLWSWFTSFYASITSFLHSGHSFGHVINLCVIDDTNMRLAVPKTDRWGLGGSSRVIAIMNNIQTLIFRYGQSDDPENKDKLRTFFVHTPMVPLERSNANGIFIGVRILDLCLVGMHW